MAEEATAVADHDSNGGTGSSDAQRHSRSKAGASDDARGILAHLRKGNVRRALISAGLIVTLAAMFAAVMPASVIKTRLMVPAQPYLNVLGLGEDWGVFAPNPRQEVIYATGILAYSDGTRSEWSFPVRPGIMAYSDYRWQKFEEHVRLDNFKGLWRPFSEYLATHEATPGKKVVQVGLVRRWAEINPPGVSPSLKPWKRYMYSVMNVGAAK
jgi:hypothetical protein